jgi:hypothetical protein
MTIGRRRGAAAALLAVAVLGPSGCSDEPEPEFAPPSPSPSASDSPVAEPTKEPWEKKTDAGAVAFAKHWMATFSEAMNSGDSAELRAISAPACNTCTAVADRIDAIESADGFYRTPGWKILRATPGPGTPDGEALVALRVLQGRETFKESADSEVVRYPDSRASYSARMTWSDGRWAMSELRVLT